MDELELFDVEDSYDGFDDDFYDDFDDDGFDDDSFDGDWFDEDDDFEAADGDAGYSKADIVAMEHLAELAMDAESDEEEDAFIGALASIASKVLPKALPLAKKLVPKLAQAGKKIFDHARRSPAVQSAIKTAPGILRKVAVDQARRVAAGQPVNLNSTLKSAARHTRSVMNNPQRRKTAVARHNRMVRQRPVPKPGMGRATPAMRRRQAMLARRRAAARFE